MSARLGHIKSIVPISLPHPRHFTMKTTPEFSRYKAELTEEIRVEPIRTMEMASATSVI